jgi:hypothetical protein
MPRNIAFLLTDLVGPTATASRVGPEVQSSCETSTSACFARCSSSRSEVPEVTERADRQHARRDRDLRVLLPLAVSAPATLSDLAFAGGSREPLTSERPSPPSGKGP